MRRPLLLFMLLILAGCANRRVFENKAENYKLILMKDSVYHLKYTTINLLQIFPRRHHEKGTYKIANDSILLKKVNQLPNDSLLGSSCFYYSKDSVILKTSNWKGLPKSITLVRK